MSGARPSAVALALLDLFSGNEPLKGDLVEEFHARGSQWWLWRQVLGALVHQQRWRGTREHGALAVPVVTVALLVLASFEVVFVTNVMWRVLVGPTPEHVSGYVFLMRLPPEAQPPDVAPLHAWIYACLRAVAVSLPAGWWLAERLHRRRRGLAIAVVIVGAVAGAVAHLRLPFALQFVSMLSLMAGFLLGGRLAAVAEAWRARSAV